MNYSEAIGQLSDYRTELTLATQRVRLMNHNVLLNKRHYIFLNSLIDSVAYPTVRLYNMVNSGSVSEDEQFRWNMVLHMNALILKDSFPTNYPVFFLPGNDGEPFSIDMEEALQTILTDWEIPHTVLTDEWEAGKLLVKAFTEEYVPSSIAVAASINGENN